MAPASFTASGIVLAAIGASPFVSVWYEELWSER
jgi:hypothetical protein